MPASLPYPPASRVPGAGDLHCDLTKVEVTRTMSGYCHVWQTQSDGSHHWIAGFDMPLAESANRRQAALAEQAASHVAYLLRAIVSNHAYGRKVGRYP